MIATQGKTHSVIELVANVEQTRCKLYAEIARHTYDALLLDAMRMRICSQDIVFKLQLSF